MARGTPTRASARSPAPRAPRPAPCPLTRALVAQYKEHVKKMFDHFELAFLASTVDARAMPRKKKKKRLSLPSRPPLKLSRASHADAGQASQSPPRKPWGRRSVGEVARPSNGDAGTPISPWRNRSSPVRATEPWDSKRAAGELSSP